MNKDSYKHNKGNKGFTLIEVLVSLTVFAVLFAAASSYTLQLYQVNNESKKNLQHTTKAQQDLENASNILLRNYDSPPSDWGPDISCHNRDVFGRLHSSANCNDNTLIPPLRRLVLQRQLTNGSVLKMHIDVAEP